MQPQHVELNVDRLNVDMVAGWMRCLKVNTATPTAASSNSSCCVDGVADVIAHAASWQKRQQLQPMGAACSRAVVM